jgi:hypothetical protein
MELGLLLVASLLVSSTAYAPLESLATLTQIVENDSKLKENYSNIGTSINGVKFSDLPSP